MVKQAREAGVAPGTCDYFSNTHTHSLHIRMVHASIFFFLLFAEAMTDLWKVKLGSKIELRFGSFLASVQFLLPAACTSFSSFHTYNRMPWVIQGVNTKQSYLFDHWWVESFRKVPQMNQMHSTVPLLIKMSLSLSLSLSFFLSFSYYSIQWRAFQVNSRRQERLQRTKVRWPTLVTGNISNTTAVTLLIRPERKSHLECVCEMCSREDEEKEKREVQEEEERKERKKGQVKSHQQTGSKRICSRDPHKTVTETSSNTHHIASYILWHGQWSLRPNLCLPNSLIRNSTFMLTQSSDTQVWE